MKITTRIKSRFVKDYNLPIKLFIEPYFTERLELIDHLFNSKEKWVNFKAELDKYNNEQDYFEYYNNVKENIINHIKSKEEYKYFCSFDMNAYGVDKKGVSKKHIFKEQNNNKRIMSIDLKKANFQAFKFFSPNLVDSKENYLEFIKQFTESYHIQNSKYIRQVVFGNLNPKRQVTIEMYIMKSVLEFLLQEIDIDIKNILSFMSDEMILDLTNLDNKTIKEVKNNIANLKINKHRIELTVEDYLLKQIPNTDFYVKIFDDGSYELKCVPSLFYPFIIKKLKNQEIVESDKVFYYEGYLSKFIESPEIKVDEIIENINARRSKNNNKQITK